MILSPELTVVFFGLLASISWGAGDFSGGFATRRQSVITVVMLSHFVGLLLYLALAILTQETVPPVSDLIWGVLAGLSGAVGLGALYSALSAGRMGMAAPIVGVLAAIIPVIVSIFGSGLPGVLKIIGFGVGIASLWLVSYSGSRVPDRRILAMALLAGLGFGFFLVLIDKVESNAVFWPLVAARVASTTAATAVALLMRQPLRPSNVRQGATITFSGLLDALANVFFVVATQTGRLDVAAVTSSLYPAATITLAWLILKERIGRLQLIGIAAALLAIILISLPA
ncbi:MAG: DMT family transporter [Anaerolineae bacterium]